MAAASVHYSALPRSSNWTATISDIKNFDISLLERYGRGFKHAIIGKETCPTSGRQHLQCFFQFNTRVRFNLLQSNLPTGTYIEIAKGSPHANFVYCSKEGDFQEYDFKGNRSRACSKRRFLS